MDKCRPSNHSASSRSSYTRNNTSNKTAVIIVRIVIVARIVLTAIMVIMVLTAMIVITGQNGNNSHRAGVLGNVTNVLMVPAIS